MKGRHISYNPAELAWIEAHRTELRADAHAAFVAKFGRTDVSLTNYHALCKRNGWHTGRTGQFVMGQVSHNKGQKGICAAGSEKGWFKKGGRSGRAKQLYKPVGTERLSKDGYLERKIHDGMPLQSRWRAVHLVEWERLNGPIPSGHALKCLDGDKTNTDPSNWAVIPRALLPRLNGRFGRSYDQAEPEVRPTIMAVAKLEHKLREVKR